MSDEYILDDVVETFSDEDTLMSDIRNNPVKWLLSLAVVGPGMAYTMTEQTSYASAMENWGLPTGLEWILAVFVTGQLFIAPLSCYFWCILVFVFVWSTSFFLSHEPSTKCWFKKGRYVKKLL